MKIKKNLEISSEDFWYDLINGGYLNPNEICEYKEDTQRVNEAIEVLREFKNSCEEQINNFIQ